MSPSVTRKSPLKRHSSRCLVSPEKKYGSPRRRERSSVKNSRSRSPSRRERSPARHRSSHRERGHSPSRERPSNRVHVERETEKVSKREHARRHEKRIDKSKHERNHREKDMENEVHVEREIEKVSERDHARHHEKRIDKSKHERNREKENEVSKDRRDQRLEIERERERDMTDAGSSRPRHRRSASPIDRHRHRSRHHSRSPPPAFNSKARDEDANSPEAGHRDDTSDSLAKMKAAEEALSTKEKHQPSFELSGKLAAETNRVRGITLLFNEPPDAQKPNVRWRLYVFKGGEVLNEPLYVHRQTCYLFGRERRVADIPTDHPSCSKQHAVLQFRQVEKEQLDGMMSKQVRPYMMDLGSTNKTFINDNPIEPQRYYELFEKDTLRFGNSSREYVLLHENSA